MSRKRCVRCFEDIWARSIEIAEDIVQETLISALETWKLNGIPEIQVLASTE
ncbi:MAG: hypothetical protein IPO48_20385 [Saprospiraceae bacterium]|nr:hypothetical protein [Saprospiraceae bacterium]